MNHDLIDFQGEVKQLLINTKRKNRLTHAYIFEGPKGVGKLDMAFYFAQMLYSKYDEPSLDEQDVMQIENNEHLNVVVIKKEDGSKVIKKEQIVSLQEEFSKTSLILGPRIYIIDEADLMNQNSQNSLLKFIEEPEDGIYGILLTTNASLLLPTITSRCNLIHFKSLDLKVFTNELIKDGIDKKLANLLVNLTNNKEEALILKDDENIVKLEEAFKSFLELKSKKEYPKFILKYQEFMQDNTNLTKFLNLLIILYEDAMNLKAKRLDVNLSNWSGYIVKISEKLEEKEIQNNLSLIYDLQRKLKSNVISKNIFLNLFVNLN